MLDAATTEKHQGHLIIFSMDNNSIVHAKIGTVEHNIPGTDLMVPEVKASYIASKSVAGREITYGSVLHTMDEMPARLTVSNAS